MSFIGQRRALVRPLLPHLAWEGVLLVVLVLVTVLGRVAEPRLLENGTFWIQWALVGLMASAVALSLRMGTPNLAVPALAGFAGISFVDRVNGGSSVAVAAIIAVLLCLVHGLLLGAFVGVTGVPAWAASLGALALLQAYLTARSQGRTTGLPGTAGLESGFVWFVLFAMVSVIGAVALAMPAVRARLVQTEPAGMSSRLVASLVGLGGSSAAAGLVGVLLARRAQSSSGIVPFDLLLLALGVALIAGVSVYGGQGPIFGVVLASGIAAMILVWNALAGRATWSQLVLAGVLILLGLLVSWLIGMLGRRFIGP